MSTLRLISLIALIALTACALDGTRDLTRLPTATTVRVLQTTPVPTFDRELHPVPSPQASATAVPERYTCTIDDNTPMLIYSVNADMDYPARSLTVHETVHYAHRTSGGLDQLVLNVRANAWPGVFTLETVQLGDDELSYELTGQRLTIDLPEMLQPDCVARFTLTFQLIIPPMDIGGVNAYKGYLGYSDRQINLGHWLPTLAVRQGDDWVSHNEIPIGEQDVLDDADWDVTLNISGAPENLTIAAPGEIVSQESGRWQFRLPSGRDFSLSMSDQFRMTKRQIENGVTVEMYSYADALLPTDSGTIDTPVFALDVAATSLGMYSDLYGAFPYPRMVVVQGDFPDGMEFSGIVFVGGEYFRGFGGPGSYLLLITVHEIAHQWWYSRVGNDQAIDPWLDEALATYSEYVFIEEYFPALKDWWWDFRVNVYSPQGFVDSTVYEFETRREYINAVYLRGVRMLHDLRTTLGTDAFFDWLRRYAEGGGGRIVDAVFFWSLLTPEQFSRTALIREEYLHQPQIVEISGESEQTPEVP